MMQLSSGAWIGLICLGVVILASGLILWSAWRQRTNANQPSRNKGPDFTRVWREEDDKLRELSERVKSLTGDNKDST